MAQLRKMAQFYRRPISDFFLPAPPEDRPLPHDFRRLPGHGLPVYSKDLRCEIRAAMERREIALDLYDDLGEDPPQLDALLDHRWAPEQAGQWIRQLLGVTLAVQGRWREPRTHYREWRTRIENAGVLVFQVTSVAAEQMLGFSIATRPLPVVAVNRAVRPNGRTFSLLHEFVHVLLTETSSLCDLSEDALRPPEEQRLEIFCNAVAAAALMTREDILAHTVVVAHPINEMAWSRDELSDLSRTFGASEEAVTRRLLGLGRASNAFYMEVRARANARGPEPPPGAEFKRNMPQEVLSNFGRPFARLVLDTYADSQLSLSDVARLFGIRAGQVSKVRRLLEQ